MYTCVHVYGCTSRQSQPMLHHDDSCVDMHRYTCIQLGTTVDWHSGPSRPRRHQFLHGWYHTCLVHKLWQESGHSFTVGNGVGGQQVPRCAAVQAMMVWAPTPFTAIHRAVVKVPIAQLLMRAYINIKYDIPRGVTRTVRILHPTDRPTYLICLNK